MHPFVEAPTLCHVPPLPLIGGLPEQYLMRHDKLLLDQCLNLSALQIWFLHTLGVQWEWLDVAQQILQKAFIDFFSFLAFLYLCNILAARAILRSFFSVLTFSLVQRFRKSDH